MWQDLSFEDWWKRGQEPKKTEQETSKDREEALKMWGK